MLENNLQNYLSDLSVNPQLMAFHKQDKIQSMTKYGVSQEEIKLVINSNFEAIGSYLSQKNSPASGTFISGWII
ncbi:hypothetical protein [Aliikangiella coralliicola]|uniref:Extradiol ring-cleavage dioxygenase LigAB LigA subunit domain-containing protein n=1 Tax=Aliikangiella coralliicola TaxID=2592383 RepID=A0A545UGN5_9GAMM|nr:hypothetical protein [Aliikangiella coralliicola]TQV88644.1 hypothetical protein FLL46_09010 [Aliikangiella coralliicola]